MTTLNRNRSSLATAAAFVLLATATTVYADTGPNKVYGKVWAWDNYFNNSNIPISFGNWSTPTWAVGVNFSSYNLYGYPASIRGWHYGWNPANDSLFPRQIAKTHAIPCAFSYASAGTSMAGDFAYDMFLRNDSQKSAPQLEVMVWAGNNSWPIGGQTGASVLTAGGFTFDVWEGANKAAGYYTITFIPHGTAGKGDLPTSGRLKVDMMAFFNWLAANRGAHFNKNMYLDVVEAGCEITRGTGSISSSYFSCDAN